MLEILTTDAQINTKFDELANNFFSWFPNCESWEVQEATPLACSASIRNTIHYLKSDLLKWTNKLLFDPSFVTKQIKDRFIDLNLDQKEEVYSLYTGIISEEWYILPDINEISDSGKYEEYKANVLDFVRRYKKRVIEIKSIINRIKLIINSGE